MAERLDSLQSTPIDRLALFFAGDIPASDSNSEVSTCFRFGTPKASLIPMMQQGLMMGGSLLYGIAGSNIPEIPGRATERMDQMATSDRKKMALN